jgi:hypothetical protein
VAILSALPPSQVAALATLAEVHLADGRPEAAVAAASEAMRLLDELGSVSEGEALARFTYARALAAAGETAAARAAADLARSRLVARADAIYERRRAHGRSSRTSPRTPRRSAAFSI